MGAPEPIEVFRVKYFRHEGSEKMRLTADSYFMLFFIQDLRGNNVNKI